MISVDDDGNQGRPSSRRSVRSFICSAEISPLSSSNHLRTHRSISISSPHVPRLPPLSQEGGRQAEGRTAIRASSRRWTPRRNPRSRPTGTALILRRRQCHELEATDGRWATGKHGFLVSSGVLRMHVIEGYPLEHQT